jgi:hypothetical protein
MSVSGRPLVYVLGTFIVALVGFVGITSAESRAPTNGEFRAECATRVNELEAEVRALREKLRMVAECPISSSSMLGRSKMSSRADAGAKSAVAGLQRGASAQSDTCNPPFGFDGHGIKYYRPECLVSGEAPACSIPYAYTPTGVRYYKPACIDSTPSGPSCDPAFVFDASGVKRYKPECL